MSGIIKRTVFYEKGSGGEFRFHDFALVNTEIGAMVELMQPISERKAADTPFRNYDAADEMARVDEIKELVMAGEILGERVTWGTASPKTGR